MAIDDDNIRTSERNQLGHVVTNQPGGIGRRIGESGESPSVQISLWFVLLSPLFGVLLGFVALWLFAVLTK